MNKALIFYDNLIDFRKFQPGIFVVALLLFLFTAAGTVSAQQINDVPDQRTSESLKKPSKANVLLSLLIPGAGEWRSGNKGLAKFFLGMDLTLWLGFWGSKQYTNLLQNDLESFAALHAGVNPAGKGGQYWIDIGSSNSIYRFNEEKLLERNLAARYAVDGNNDWAWDSEENRLDYVGQRLNRLDWKRSTTWVVSGLVLNRIISAIDVVRLIRRQNNDTQARSRKSLLTVNYHQNIWQGETYRLNFSWILN